MRHVILHIGDGCGTYFSWENSDKSKKSNSQTLAIPYTCVNSYFDLP